MTANDTLLSRAGASLAATDGAGPAENTGAPARVPAAHMEHEENQALPLTDAHPGPAGRAAFPKAAGKSQGLRADAGLFPWMLDGAPAGTSNRVPGMPPPARLPYRAARRPRYAHPAPEHRRNPTRTERLSTMKLTIFGASGATGTSLVQQALAAGHQVTAVVRDPARLAIPAHQRLQVVTASVLDPAAISPAMQETGTRRLLIISGSIVADNGESPLMRYLLKPAVRRTFLRHACADMRHAENEVHHSNLDWTILRPPSLTNKTATGTYPTATDRNLPRGFSISRADLAACMLTLLDDPAANGRHITIAS